MLKVCPWTHSISSPGSLLEMQILGLNPKPTESETLVGWVGAQQSV